MTLNNYFESPDFQALLDETLRSEAVRAVDTILSRVDPVKKNQLHSIPAAVHAAGYRKIKELTEKQKEKNSKEKIKAFWTEMNAVISKTGNSDISLYNFIKTTLIECGLIESEDTGMEKKELKQLKNRNKKLIEIVMDRILPAYFEHFNCHYFYMTREGESQ